MEEWKEITNYSNYSVSNKGNIQNNKTQRILRPTLRNGYYAVSLCKNNKKKTFHIHTLVASEFLIKPSTDKKYVVNHKNEIKTDNRVDNLEYMTYSENTSYSTTSNRSYNTIVLDYNICSSIPQFSCYKVSQNGDVYSISSNKFMCHTVLPNKYHKIKLKSDDNKYYDMYIHVLVAMTYLNYISGDRNIVINHIDGNKENNSVSNLEIVTQKENMKHSVKLNNHKIFRMKVYYINSNGDKIVFPSAKDAASCTSIDHSSIIKSCKKKVKHAGNIEWFYETN